MKVIVKASTDHSAQRSIELGRPVTKSTMKGVAGMKQSIALVRAASALTTTMHRWVSSSLGLMRLRERASCSSEATCMHRVAATAVCSYCVSTRVVGVRANTAPLNAAYAATVKAMRSTEVEGRRSVIVKALVSSALRRRLESSVAAEPGSSSEKVTGFASPASSPST